MKTVLAVSLTVVSLLGFSVSYACGGSDNNSSSSNNQQSSAINYGHNASIVLASECQADKADAAAAKKTVKKSTTKTVTKPAAKTVDTSTPST